MLIDTFYFESFGSVPVDVSRQYNEKGFFTHIQDSIELLLVNEGGLRVEINDVSHYAGVGDILLFNPFDKHTIFIADGLSHSDYYCLIFEPSFFERALPQEIAAMLCAVRSGKARFVSRISADDGNAAFLRAQFPVMYTLFRRRQPLDDVRMEGLLYQMLAELLEDYYDDDPGIPNRNFEFTSRVIGYVEAHYREPLTTASICEALSWSKSHFCHRFRESFGTTFSDYLCRCRIEHAAALRGKKGMTLLDIAGQVGFAEYGYFSRSFRKYMGVPPKQYFEK